VGEGSSSFAGHFPIPSASPCLQAWVVDTLEGNKVEVIAFVLYITDHPAYDRIFGYRKK
jgi:hypothetical protein